MTLTTKQVVLGALACVAAGALAAWCVGDQKLEALKAYSDSVAVVAQERLAEADSIGAALEDSVKALQAKKNKVIVVARRDSATVARLDSALAQAATDSARISILTEQNDALKSEVTNLWAAVALADSATAAAHRRGDMYKALAFNQTEEIRKLNERVQGLSARMPKWARVTTYVATFAAGVYAGMQSH